MCVGFIMESMWIKGSRSMEKKNKNTKYAHTHKRSRIQTNSFATTTTKTPHTHTHCGGEKTWEEMSEHRTNGFKVGSIFSSCLQKAPLSTFSDHCFSTSERRSYRYTNSIAHKRKIRPIRPNPVILTNRN